MVSLEGVAILRVGALQSKSTLKKEINAKALCNIRNSLHESKAPYSTLFPVRAVWNCSEKGFDHSYWVRVAESNLEWFGVGLQW